MLVIEDDNTNRAMLRMALEQAGYEVDEARNGQVALARLRASQERLVVLVDLVMPVLDGIQLLQVVAADGTLATRHAYTLVSANLDMLSDTRPGGQSSSAIASLRERLQMAQVLKPYGLERLLTCVRDAAARVAGTC